MNSIFDEARAALFSVWHRRWLALGVAWVICMIGWLLIALIPNSYESKARIFVQMDDVLAEVTGVPSDSKRDIDRVRQTLTSAVNLEKIVRSTRLGLDATTPAAMENAVLELSRTVKVESQQENLFEITGRYGDGTHSDADNARLAQDIVQKMIDIFRDENLSGNRGEMTQSLEFMNKQLVVRQKELESAEQKRLAFEAQNPDAAGGGLSVLQKLEASRAELRGIDADLAAAQSALAAINGQLAGTPKSLPGTASSGGARGAFAQAQADLSSMKARGLTDNHPDVIAARNQVAALRTQAASEGGPGGVPNPAYSSLESIRADRQATVMGLSARRAAVQGDVSRITSQQITNPQVAAEQQRINRDYDVLKQQYDKLLQDREELRLRGSVQSEHNAIRFQVIDPPTTPRDPVWPNRPLLLLGVLLAGIGGGVAAAFAVGQLRSTFATTSALERALDLPVLGAITTTLTDSGRTERRRRARLFYAASAGLGGVFVLLMTAEFIQRVGVA